MERLDQKPFPEEGLTEGVTLLAHAKEGLKCFQKKKYPDCFCNLMEQYRELFLTMEQDYLNVESDTASLEVFSEELVQCAQSKIKTCRWKFRQENIQADLSMFMVVYVIPMILEYDFTMSEQLAQILLAKWNDTFHTKLEAGRFEQICGGFKNRIFGISLGEGK